MAQVVMFYTSVSGSAKIKKDTQSLRWLLEKKNCAFDEVDVARDQMARGRMKQVSGTAQLPQVHVNGKYIGSYDQCQTFEEEERFEDILDGEDP